MIKRGRSAQAFLARVAYPMYQSRQMQRWITEGNSEGMPWSALDPKYRAWKRRQYAGFPGNGNRMLIRTGLLAESVIGRKFEGQLVSPDSEASPGKAAFHRVLITNQSMYIQTEVEYAKYVNEKRKMFVFKKDFAQSIKTQYAQWVVRGKTS